MFTSQNYFRNSYNVCQYDVHSEVLNLLTEFNYENQPKKIHNQCQKQQKSSSVETDVTERTYYKVKENQFYDKKVMIDDLYTLFGKDSRRQSFDEQSKTCPTQDVTPFKSKLIIKASKFQ